jgi:hypothetical protein
MGHGAEGHGHGGDPRAAFAPSPRTWPGSPRRVPSRPRPGCSPSGSPAAPCCSACTACTCWSRPASACGATTSPVGWAFDITNFVFWIGIGHAGTLISAILFLFRQGWRTSINRFAEAMTIFAVMCAGIFPHPARGPALAGYWMFPHPNEMACGRTSAARCCGTCSRSRPTHHVAAVLVHGPGPRPRHLPRPRQDPGPPGRSTASSRWAGAARPVTGTATRSAYLILAGLATPLVLSVHSVVSFDFATSQLPGWHTTIFPPYFVAGASSPASRWC